MSDEEDYRVEREAISKAVKTMHARTQRYDEAVALLKDLEREHPVFVTQGLLVKTLIFLLNCEIET